MRHKDTSKKRLLQKITKNYFLGKFENNTAALFKAIDKINTEGNLSYKDIKNLEKLFSIFFLGHLIGLPTLNAILESFNIISNNLQINYKKICKKVTQSNLLKMYEMIFQYNLEKELEILSKKHKSCFSRELVTVVLDDSIFKIIFGKNTFKDEETKLFYSAFFSGQYRASVMGFKVLTLAVVIDEVLYPLFFNFVAKNTIIEEKKQNSKVEKKEVKPIKKIIEEQKCEIEAKSLETTSELSKKDKKLLKEELEKEKQEAKRLKQEAKKLKQEEKRLKKEAKIALKNDENNLPAQIKVAKKIVQKYGEWQKKLQEKNIILPNFHLSCDSGYSHSVLSEVCKNNDLKYISVPKKNHQFEINGAQTNLNNFIKNVFLVEEKKHLEQESDGKNNGKKEPFTMRVIGRYISQNKKVVLLFFRLNNSDKVSVIYTTDDINIFAKTLRRHWFDRTYIEQFFKTLKHVLKIQNSLVKNKSDFEIKLYLFSFMAWHLQKLVRIIRKKIPEFRKRGILDLQKILAFNNLIPDLLQEIITNK